MKITLGTSLFALACGAIFTAGTALSATCHVPADYPTIQAAVNDPSCSEVDVAPGVYNENIIVNRTVEIDGAQAGNPDFTTRDLTLSGESIVKGAGPTVSTP